ncbi:beta-galactosidase trimerization domain-containing protein [Flavihumibacter sp. RY-1]|uniref:Beta-galactosidase trimerization domain-containing protein n=1 Tax=Flavihumibacter fluminis TaxID=2909236 RepID=A0ABS9BDA9_9BACT|nr:alpha-amylase family protein [Flavihumibacter fluminis]MCF1713691.1 beta-galactosidase trimerization domain-containing protein [Flavihumibacter fluminis]
MVSRRSFIRNSGLAASSLLVLPHWLQAGFAPAPFTAGGYASLRYRQVHLDYHTSELIPDVAQDFDPEEFASTLKKAYVNSVTVFGRCHHGYIYHNSKKFADRIHPHLKRNLLKEQIEACHKQGIRTPVYVTVQWDYLTAKQHPEWLMRDDAGAPIAFGDTNRFHPGFYNHLCVLTPYIDFLKSYIADLFEQVPVDGLFLDIHHVRPNANEYCIDAMLKKGLDPSKEQVRYDFYKEVMREYKQDLSAFIRKLDKDCTIFYNGGHVGPQIRSTFVSNTHLELESLPSGGWGYLHFPLTARYARNFNQDIMGMTGKFHTSWGDFHSLKNKAALEFETSMMLAMNARCSIGDQLHPRGRLDAATYDLIGSAYKQIAEKEAWCEGAKAFTEIGVLSTEEFVKGDVRQPASMLGAVKLLQEGSMQFDILDSSSTFDKYKVLILPDEIPVDPALKSKLQQYLSRGGKLIASFQSGLSPDGKSFALNEFGVSLVGPAPYSPDFIRTRGAISDGLPDTELVMYERGMEVKTNPGAEVLAETTIPYFNREWDHFSSHKHTPSSGKTGYPAIVKNDSVIYFMHPIFSQYAKNAPAWCKKFILNALKLFIPEPIVKHNGPSSLVTALNEQAEQNRLVLHLLHYLPERKGADFDIIEDVIPLYDLKVSVKTEKAIRKVRLVPQQTSLSFRKVGSRLEITLPKLNGHQMIELS